MIKRLLMRILCLVSLLPSLTVAALPGITPVKAWNPVPIIETGFGVTNVPLVLKHQALPTQRLQIIGLTGIHLQFSPSITLKFDYAAMEHRKIRDLKRSVQTKGVKLGLLVRF